MCTTTNRSLHFAYIQCLAWRQHELLADLYAYLQQQTNGSHYHVRQQCNETFITQLSLVFGHTGLELHLRIDIHTGEVQLDWNDKRVSQWCREVKSFPHLRICLKNHLPLQEWLDQHFQYAVLFSVQKHIASINSHHHSVFTHEQGKPALLLPCHIESSTLSQFYHRYYLRISLVPHDQGQNTGSQEFSGASVEALLKRGGPSYHSINNKMDALGFMGEGEIGFDIDGEEPALAAEDNTGTAQWSIDLLGMHESDTLSPLHEIHRVISCDDPGNVEFQNQICHAVLVMFTQLRYYEMKIGLNSLKSKNVVKEFTPNSEKLLFSVCME